MLDYSPRSRSYENNVDLLGYEKEERGKQIRRRRRRCSKRGDREEVGEEELEEKDGHLVNG